MTFDELHALTQHQEQHFGRDIRTEIYYPGDYTLAITRMHDTWHDMELAVYVNAATGLIDDIAGKIVRGPHATCHATEDVLKRLIGVHATQSGVLKKVRERIPRIDGCVHFYEIVEATLRSLSCAPSHPSTRKFTEWPDLNDEEDRHYNMMGDWLPNTCHSYNLDTANPKMFVRVQEKFREKGLPEPPIPERFRAQLTNKK